MRRKLEKMKRRWLSRPNVMNLERIWHKLWRRLVEILHQKWKMDGPRLIDLPCLFVCLTIFSGNNSKRCFVRMTAETVVTSSMDSPVAIRTATTFSLNGKNS